ncbi:MAG: MarR family transcriptional regulator [Nisaea sp.]|uniref:MarR family winged helix-turn-helix transcriptional regulator n=1 Tax=Nisaea sp. TaxID=2024842 RepID=UPI001AFE77FB|nr:MarR family transcriptional regulator [Nisaea sp.]MBO6560985.1 MarR family transcriptional regulator [Nisaea sp.]
MTLEIHGMIGHLIRRLNQISVSVFQDRMRAEGYDLTQVQYAAMAALAHHPGVDQATLAGLIAYDRATMGSVLERLVERGWVDRRVSERDRRARELFLTSEGTALIEAVSPMVREIQGLIVDGLDTREQAEFLRLAAKLADAGNTRSRVPLIVPETYSAA